MMSLWLLLILFVACGVVVFVFQRLQGVSNRLKELHEDMARNDEQLRRHLTRLQAIEEAENNKQLQNEELTNEALTQNKALTRNNREEHKE